MNDTLAFFRTPFEERKDAYNKLTFSMVYFYDEHFVLPFSHDEVVHGKGTIVNKMHGTRQQKMDQARALYLYMMTHPGKKLNFMGNELAQFREWNEKKPQDWNLLEDPEHKAFASFIHDLNRIYSWYPALSEKDYDRDGYLWLQADDPEHQVLAFVRKADASAEQPEKTSDLLAVFNLSDQDLDAYELPLKKAGKLVQARTILDSSWPQYSLRSQAEEKREIREDSLVLSLPALSGRLMEVTFEEEKEPAEPENEA